VADCIHGTAIFLLNIHHIWKWKVLSLIWLFSLYMELKRTNIANIYWSFSKISIATVCFHPPIFMRKTLDGNAKMFINSKNAHKKCMCSIVSDNYLSDKKTCTQTMMETHLPNKSPIAATWLQMFDANFPGSDDFVLLNTRDGNAALFTNVLCDIPILLLS